MTSLSSGRMRRRCRSSRRSCSSANSCTRRPQARDVGVDLGLGLAAAQDLGAVVADVGDRAERHDPPRGRGAPAADAGDQPVALGDRDQRRARRLGHVGVVGVADDRRQRAVDVEQDRGARRVGRQRGERVVEGRGRRHAPIIAACRAGTRRSARRATRLAPGGDRHRRRAVQRPVRRRRRHGHRAAARAVARLRRARGDRHVARRDRR